MRKEKKPAINISRTRAPKTHEELTEANREEKRMLKHTNAATSTVWQNKQSKLQAAETRDSCTRRKSSTGNPRQLGLTFLKTSEQTCPTGPPRHTAAELTSRATSLPRKKP